MKILLMRQNFEIDQSFYKNFNLNIYILIIPFFTILISILYCNYNFCILQNTFSKIKMILFSPLFENNFFYLIFNVILIILLFYKLPNEILSSKFILILYLFSILTHLFVVGFFLLMLDITHLNSISTLTTNGNIPLIIFLVSCYNFLFSSKKLSTNLFYCILIWFFSIQEYYIVILQISFSYSLSYLVLKSFGEFIFQIKNSNFCFLDILPFFQLSLKNDLSTSNNRMLTIL